MNPTHESKRAAVLALLQSKPEVTGAELEAVGKQGYRQRVSDLRSRGHRIKWVLSLANGLGVFRYEGCQSVDEMRSESKSRWMESPNFSMRYVREVQ